MDEEAAADAERARFEELADQYRQQSHLPPQADQSWREQEAMRRAASDKGYAAPQNDQSWRDREAMLFTPAREDAADAIAEQHREPQETGLTPVPIRKAGQGGTILIFILMAAIALGIAVLAYPEMLTAAYWRTPDARTNSVTQPAPPRAVQPPTAPAMLSTAPTQDAPPPVAPAPDLKHIPDEPVPPVQEAPPPSVPVIDARPNPAAAPKPVARSQAPARSDRSASGFYAKVPGPDGVMRDTFFPADPQPPSQKAVRKAPAVPETGGFYAKVPGPDGTLELKHFPSTPPPR